MLLSYRETSAELLLPRAIWCTNTTIAIFAEKYSGAQRGGNFCGKGPKTPLLGNEIASVGE